MERFGHIFATIPTNRAVARRRADGLRQALQAQGKWFMMPGRQRHECRNMGQIKTCRISSNFSIQVGHDQ
jgi:hypothetical protein